ncbi:hypothetical protein DUNSADRAFT_14312, partial [Dunaliella salina]
VLDSTEISARDTEHLRTSCVARVGISQRCTDVGRLGEVKAAEGISVGYNSTGKKVSGSRMEPYGEAFGPGDQITVLVDLTGSASTGAGMDADSPTGRVSYAKNGVWQGLAHTIPLNHSKQEWFHPHLLLRNCQASIQVQETFTISAATPDAGVALEEHYSLWCAAISEGHGITSLELPPPTSSCELIMMVGLPGSGKSTWAQHFMLAHPEKRYMLLGPEMVLDQMRLLGLRQASRTAAQGALDGSLVLESYMGVATAALNQLLVRAVELPRNYILDQTNVSASKRAARLAPFCAAGYQVKAALAAPLLDWLHYFQETSRQDGGGMRLMPEQVMAELMAGFEVPFPGGPEGFSDVLIVHPVPLPPDTSNEGNELNESQLSLEEKLHFVDTRAVEPQRELGRRWLEQHRSQKSNQEEQPLQEPQAQSQGQPPLQPQHSQQQAQEQQQQQQQQQLPVAYEHHPQQGAHLQQSFFQSQIPAAHVQGPPSTEFLTHSQAGAAELRNQAAAGLHAFPHNLQPDLVQQLPPEHQAFMQQQLQQQPTLHPHSLAMQQPLQFPSILQHSFPPLAPQMQLPQQPHHLLQQQQPVLPVQQPFLPAMGPVFQQPPMFTPGWC